MKKNIIFILSLCGLQKLTATGPGFWYTPTTEELAQEQEEYRRRVNFIPARNVALEHMRVRGASVVASLQAQQVTPSFRPASAGSTGPSSQPRSTRHLNSSPSFETARSTFVFPPEGRQ